MIGAVQLPDEFADSYVQCRSWLLIRLSAGREANRISDRSYLIRLLENCIPNNVAARLSPTEKRIDAFRSKCGLRDS